MNIKRYFLAVVSLFIFIFGYEFIVHGHLLMSMYGKTPNVWRNYSQMQNFIPFNIGVMVFLSFWITFIFTQFFKSGGWKNGLYFGFYVGVLSGIQAAGAYYYLPISFVLALAWFVFGVIESMVGGLLIGCIYRN